MATVWQNIIRFGGPVIVLLLTAIVGYAFTQQQTLSLPIPIPLTIFTGLLPAFAYLSTKLIHRLLFPNQTLTHTMAPNQTSPRLTLSLPLLILQTLYTTAILTFSLTQLSTSTLSCLLSSRWALLFRHRNAAAIRQIQETFECCGFSGMRDRAFPFPVGREGEEGWVGNGECERRYGYKRSCEGPWGGAERGVVGKLVAVGGVVVLFQIIYYVSVLYPQSTTAWTEALKAITGTGNGTTAAERRRNMRGLIQADVDGDNERVREVLDREEEESELGDRGSSERRLEAGEGGNNGPRLETSPLLDGWRESGGHGTVGSGNGAYL